MANIDWPFIYGREDGPHGRWLTGYWPGGSSGVTIADGVDLGQMTAEEANQFPADLRVKIDPYIGVRGSGAEDLLRAHPLTLTDEECEQIEEPKRASMLRALAVRYEMDANCAFDDIPDAAQTVMMSVSWQYGAIWARCPHFWRECCARNWPQVIAELRDFHDPYPTRRNTEADYLAVHLGPRFNA